MLFSLLIVAFKSEAFRCYILAGDAQTQEVDHNGSFILNLKYLSGDKKYPFSNNCQRVSSWTELAKNLEEESKRNLKLKNERVMIHQASHGLREGGAVLNCGTESGKSVLAAIDKIAAVSPKLFFSLDSCYSGDMIWPLLSNEKLNNACWILASQPGRASAMTNDNLTTVLEKTEKGTSAEGLFLKSDASIISSAPWNESGLIKYKTSKDVQMGTNLLEKISKYGGFCKQNIPRRSAKLCNHPLYNDEQASKIFSAEKRIGESKISVEEIENINSDQLSNLVNAFIRIENREQIYIARFDYLIKLTQVNIAKAKAMSLIAVKDIERLSFLIKEKAIYENRKTCFNKIKSEIESNFKAQDTISHEKSAELIINQLDVLFKQKVCKSLTDPKHPDYDPNDDPKFIIANASVDKSSLSKSNLSSPAGKTKILDNLIGESFFPEEFVNSTECRSTPDIISPSAALDAFVRGSLASNDPYPNPIDQQRRKACQDFKLGVDD